MKIKLITEFLLSSNKLLRESKLFLVRYFFIVCLVNPVLSYAVDPRLEWKTIESDNFYIHYAVGYERLARKVANSAEQAHIKLQPELNWLPDEKTHLVVSDETDSPNGFATPIHFNRSVLFMAPPASANTVEDFDDWLETLITHEYTHILHLDKVDGGAGILRYIFGRQFLLFPNAYQPNWFTEGLATYYETDHQKGIGRGQSTIFDMMMRIEVINGLKPVDQVNLPIRSWPLGTVAYLYGVNFYQFINDQYGKQTADLLVHNYSNNIIPFMINSNSEEVFEKDIEALWEELSIWLDNKYSSEIELLREQGIVEGKKISDYGYGTGSIDNTNSNRILYVANGAFEHSALVEIYGDKQRQLAEVHNGATIDVHLQSGVLITQNEFCDEYNINSDLYILEPGEEDAEAITECGRFRAASWSPDGRLIAAVKTDRAQSELVLLNKQGKTLEVLWQGNYTDIVTQIQWSPDGKKILAAVFRTDNGWNIEEFNVKSKQWKQITNDRYIDMYPSYSNNGEVILFSSERSGQYQIYRYTGKYDQLEQLTRVMGGAFNPVQQHQDAPLYYVGYNANGHDIYRLDKVKALENWPINNDVQSEVVLASEVEVTEAVDYSALSSMYPRWWFPFISLNEDRNEYGITTAANDALGIHNYFLKLAYDTNNEWFVGDFNYAYAGRMSMGYQRSTDILRDQNGDFAVARKSNDIFISVAFNSPGIESSTSFQLGATVSETSDGIRAQGIPPLEDTKDNLLGGAILFNNTNSYIRSISQNDGRGIRLIAETTEAFESDFSGEIYTLDWREYLSLGGQHVLALRAVQGWGTDDPKPFRLGGENNEIGLFDFINPVSEPLFGRRKYSLRGYAEGLPQLEGRRMQLATLEWRFPGDLLERGWMAPPVGIIQWSGSVFTETGAAYDESSVDEYFSSAGIELQADINLFYGLTSRMRLGFASGLDENVGENRYYFNLGASF